MGPAWLVDANNVLGSRPDGWWRDRPAAVARLLDEVTRWRATVDHRIVVVVDGAPSARVPEGCLYGVEVRYAHSRDRDAADDTIVGLVADEPEPTQVTVVTSDRGLVARVRGLGATVESASRFLSRIADIDVRRQDRAILARFGTDESALLGRGGESRVFALNADLVLRLPHRGTDPASLDHRRALLATLATGPRPMAIPEVVEHQEVDGRVVVIERRLRGQNALDVLGRRDTRRERLVRHHLDIADRVVEFACPTARFGELYGPDAVSAPTFRTWSEMRLKTSLARAGPHYVHLSAARLTAELIDALPEPEPPSPRLVHLDAYLGNMLAEDDAITALLDFGPMSIGGPARLDPLVAVAYLAPEITPTATEKDRQTAENWARERGLGPALAPAERWIAAYWAGAIDDHRLQRWCRRVLAAAT